jgi:hypothetical protein
MTGRVVVFVFPSICGLLSTFAGYEMMDKVNAKLPKEDQFDPLGWYWSTTRRLHREYKRLYPSGRLSLNSLKARILWGALLLRGYLRLEPRLPWKMTAVPCPTNDPFRNTAGAHSASCAGVTKPRT